MRRARILRSFPLLVIPILIAGCGGDVPEPDAAEIQAAEVIPAALVDLFDSIAWSSPADALDRGATVFAYSCAKCHGDRGAGNGGYRLQGRVLRPPSFRTLDWRFANDLAGLREAIYRGTDRGMPHWGEAGLASRDIDAVARYIMDGLRADLY
jgi:mono/diheme cytochrome c family protein